ncbi:MAG: glucose-6-phosphate dehydrogenase assembly protein OpcA [Verrucomicrobiota bacterium JB022]|nr:glucose-6-phosphate dehydrogenase assembly protein OpcA [Verrucomicrobiota bacterium JB022]
MPQLIDSLPGIPLPISDVNRTLRHMWDAESTSPDGGGEPHAMQLNLVLHFGPDTTEEEGSRCFEAAIHFAQRYPCRVIVLCPDTEEGEEMRAKLFSQCYLGPNLRDMCCCEAIIVSQRYTHDASLENQVSLWIESDLPVYHWLHRVPVDRLVKGPYMGFLKRSTRIFFDRQVEGDAYRGVAWPDARRLRDLAFARSLPMRQNFGQFLSGFPLEALTSNFEGGIVRTDAARRGAAEGLASWMGACLTEAFARQGIERKVEIPVEMMGDAQGPDIEAVWNYSDRHRYLKWNLDLDSRTGHVDCNFGSGKIAQAFHLELLETSGELSEALFF